MDIITSADLASYLEVEDSPGLLLKVELTNGLISELPFATPLPNPAPTRVKVIALEMAARAVRNPNGYSSETIDDYTYRRDSSTRQAGIYMTPDERAELLAIGGVASSSAFSVAMLSPMDVP